VRRWPAIALLVSAVLYNSWLLQPWLNPAMTVVNAYISELAARNQPGGAVFRLSDVAAGGCALAAGLTLAIFSGGLFRAGWIGVAIFGLATMFDGGVTSLDCSPSTDKVCAALAEAGRLPRTHELHPVSTGVAFGGIIAAAICLTLAVGRGQPPRVWARRIGLILCGALGVTTVAVGIAGQLDTHPVGIWQRLQTLAVTGVLIWAAWLTPRHGP
jgi:hypothetical protein